MIYTANPVLSLGPKALKGIGMNTVININLVRMIDRAVVVSHHGKHVIGVVFVRVDFRTAFHVRPYDREDGFGFGVLDLMDFQLAAAISQPEYGSLGLETSTTRMSRFLAGMFVLFFPAEVGFIGFGHARKLLEILEQHPAHLLAHSPSALVSNARFPLDLLGRNPAASLRHEVDDVEPYGQGSWGLVEDRARRRGELPAAVITAINLALGDAVKLLFASAVFALDDFGKPLTAKVIQAGVIIGKHLVEIFEGEFRHRVFHVGGSLCPSV